MKGTLTFARNGQVIGRQTVGISNKGENITLTPTSQPHRSPPFSRAEFESWYHSRPVETFYGEPEVPEECPDGVSETVFNELMGEILTMNSNNDREVPAEDVYEWLRLHGADLLNLWGERETPTP